MRFLLGSDCKKEESFSKINLLDDNIYEHYPSYKTGALVNLIDSYKSKSFLSIGLVGDWGSGKSSYLNILSKKLRNKHIIININVWELGNQSNIINELEKELDNEIFKNNFLVWIISIVKNLLVKNYFKILKKYYSLNKNIIDMSLTPTMKDSKNKFSKVIQEAFYGKKLIIILDELDRINDKKEIYNIFNTIRHLTSFDNAIVITAVDLNQLSSKIESIEYIHKIFNTKYFIPKHTRNEMTQFLKKKASLFIKNSDELLNTKHNGKSIIDTISNYREIKNCLNDTLLLTESLKNLYSKDWSDFINIEFIFILNLIKAIDFRVFNKIYKMENIDYSQEEILSFNGDEFKKTYDSFMNNEVNKNTKMKKILKDDYAKNIEVLEYMLKSFVNGYDINQCFYIYKHHQIEDFLSTNSEYEKFIKDKKEIQMKYDKLSNEYQKQFLIFLTNYCYRKKELVENTIEIIFDNNIEDEDVLRCLVINNGNNTTLITQNTKEIILKLKKNNLIFTKLIELIIENFDANMSKITGQKILFEDSLLEDFFTHLKKEEQEKVIKNTSFSLDENLIKKLEELVSEK
ncbi:MAG: P-loop NTPase fold protein [Campylobacterota bacterium]|nr:P-loop NTPase fold protein [Campylobacterota bacterium]